MAVGLKQKLADGKVTNVLGIGQLCHPKIIEMAADSGLFDAVWLDQEHVGLTVPQLEEASRAARASGIDCFCRLNATDYATVMRPLEAGVGGVMASMIRNVEQARDVVRWSKFHPQGERGVNGTGADGRFGTIPMAEYFRKSNEETIVLIQIEHADAVACVEELAALPEVDCLFIGPADLSQSMGIPGDWENPKLWQAFETVARAAAANKRAWAILPIGPTFAKRCVDMGCQMLSVSMDVWLVSKGLKAVKEEYGL